jgi:hypothetical protein
LGLDPDQEPLDDQDFDEYYLRDMTEKICLMFLSQLVNRYDAEKLVKAKFVEKWLARQNWGSTPVDRMNNFKHYMDHKNNRISDVVGRVKESRSGKEALAKAGLWTEEAEEADTGSLGLTLSFKMGGDDGERLVTRSLEQSAEAQRVRHRHREAMVINDGSRPFNSEDIIQRDLGSPP